MLAHAASNASPIALRERDHAEHCLSDFAPLWMQPRLSHSLHRASATMPELLPLAATGAIPYGFMRAQPIAPEVFPVGDQLAAVPSFTGDGMAIALYRGRAAARALLGGQ